MGGCYEKGRFQTNNYKYSTNSVQLKDDAVPHIFDFPEHLYGKVVGKRLPPKKHMAFKVDEVKQPSCSKNETKVQKLNTSPSNGTSQLSTMSIPQARNFCHVVYKIFATSQLM